MAEYLPIGVCLIVVTALVIVISRKFNISSRYERKPRKLNSWSSLDQGIDPTEDEKL